MDLATAGCNASTVALLLSEGNSILTDYDTLVDLGVLESGIGSVIMSAIDEINQQSSEGKQDKIASLCECVSKFFSKVKEIFPSEHENLSNSERECAALLGQTKLEEVRDVVGGILQTQKQNVFGREMRAEQVGLALALGGLIGNLQRIFSGLEKMREESNKSRNDFLEEIEEQRRRFQVVEKDIQNHSGNVGSFIERLSNIVRDLTRCASHIKMSEEKHRTNQNVYYGSAIASILKAGFTLCRWYLLRDFGGLSTVNTCILGVSGAAHTLNGATSFYIGAQYGKEIAKFRILLSYAHNCMANAEKLIVHLSRAKQE